MGKVALRLWNQLDLSDSLFDLGLKSEEHPLHSGRGDRPSFGTGFLELILGLPHGARQLATLPRDLVRGQPPVGFERFPIAPLGDGRSFHQGIRIRTNLIDVYEHGHWKVNFLHKWVEEKGLDTSLAVDMVALQDNYDVAVVMSGDADNIPSIRHMKGRGKHIAAVEFVNGSPPESKGRSFSSRLKEHADFVIQIYETELLRLKIGNRPKPKARQAG